MLRIKAEQLKHFASLARRRFSGLMIEYFRASFAPETAAMDDCALREWVDRALAFCDRAGVNTEPEAAQLMALLLVLGVDAEARHPWVAPIVNRRGLHPEGKVRALFAAARHAHLPVDDVVLYPAYEPTSDVVLDITDTNNLEQGA